jgi:hypothetical protein
VRVKKAGAEGMRHLSGESSGMYTFRGGRQPTQDNIHCHDNIMYARLSGFETLLAHEKNVCIIEREGRQKHAKENNVISRGLVTSVCFPLALMCLHHPISNSISTI